MAIACKQDLVVSEHCAHVVEKTFRGQKARTFGDLDCCRFFDTTNVFTGERWMIPGRDDSHIARAKLALHGMSKDSWHRCRDKGYRHYPVAEAGFDYNMMDSQAAIGIHQLSRTWSATGSAANRPGTATRRPLPIFRSACPCRLPRTRNMPTTYSRS